MSDSRHLSEQDLLSQAVRVLRDETASDDAERIEQIAQHLSAQLAAPTVAAVGAVVGTKAASVAGWTLLKWLSGGLLVGGAVLAMTLLRPAPTPTGAEGPRSSPPTAGTSRLDEAPPTKVESQHEPEPIANRPEAKRTAASRPDRPKRTAPRAGELAATASPQAELVLLEQARAALSSQPATALRLCREHATDHPGGVFTQERELLRIEALLALQRRKAAERYARSFMETFPRSPHARLVKKLLSPKADSTKADQSGPPISSHPPQIPGVRYLE